MGTTFLRAAIMAVAISGAGSISTAEEPAPAGEISIELNTMAEGAGSCTLTFVVTNGFPVDIDKLVYETVLFDTDGTVDRLTLFDYGALPVGRARVRQFAVPDLSCDTLGRVLFNGVHTCTVPSLDVAHCGAGLVPTSRVDVEVLG